MEQIKKYWSSPDGLYTFKEDVVISKEVIDKDSIKNRILLFSSTETWIDNKKNIEECEFKGIAIIIGNLIELSEIISSIQLSKIERIIACRVKNTGHHVHKLLLVLNYSNNKRPYREIRERYTYCPSCGKSSKDYGGKKHHYPSDGTWIRDVWNIFVLEEPLENNKLFLEAIYNLYCLNSSQKIFVVKSKKQHKKKSLILNTILNDYSLIKGKKSFPTFVNNNQRLINGDCFEVLPWLKEQKELFDLVFVDPPYNLGKKYDFYDDNQNLQKYKEWCITWEKLTYPLLETDGFFVILNTPLNILTQLASILQDYEFIDDIVWDDLAVPVTGKMQPTYYSIIFLGRKKNSINQHWYQVRDAIYCKRDSCRNAPESLRDGNSIWSDIHRTRQKARRWEHPCNLPEELIERIIQITQKSLNKEHLNILDYFAGVGTTTMAAIRKNCFSTGVEISKKYFETSKYRLENLLFRNQNGKKIRNSKNGKTKRFIQKLVAKSLEESGRVGKGFTTSEQIDWLIKKKVIQKEDVDIFIRPGELLKGVGKGGAPGEV